MEATATPTTGTPVATPEEPRSGPGFYLGVPAQMTDEVAV
jgi:hypothetical protein